MNLQKFDVPTPPTPGEKTASPEYVDYGFTCELVISLKHAGPAGAAHCKPLGGPPTQQLILDLQTAD